jgi:hypothetical protein
VLGRFAEEAALKDLREEKLYQDRGTKSSHGPEAIPDRCQLGPAGDLQAETRQLRQADV